MSVLSRGLQFLLVWLVLGAAWADVTPLPMRSIAPGVFVHFAPHAPLNPENHGAIANIGFIIGDRCVAVIDTGGSPEQGRALKAALRQRTNLPVCYVINTHVHQDHILGNSAFKEPGVKFVGHSRLPRALSMRSAFYLQNAPEQLGIKLSPRDVIAPDILVENTLKLGLGNRILTLTAHPTAHTDNDLSILDEKTHTLWLGDLLFVSHIPVIDGSLKGWIKVMESLEKQHFEHVIPGHGPLVKDWPQALQPQKTYLTGLLHEIRTAIKNGVSLEQAMATIGQAARQDWQWFDVFHAKNIATAYAELEWEE